VHTPATHLQSSDTPVRPPRPYTYSTPPELPISSISTSTRLQRISRAPMPLCLLHVRTRAARLQSSRSPFLYISTSTRLQRTSRASEFHTFVSFTSLHP